MRWKDIIIDRQIQDFLGTIDEVNAFVVTQVYPGSVADEAGIKAGFYMLCHGQNRGKDVMALRFAQGEQDYTFYTKDLSKKITVRSKGYPFGMKLRQSLLALTVALESHDHPDYEAAAAAVHEGSDQDFLKIAVAAGQSPVLKTDGEEEGISTLMNLLKETPHKNGGLSDITPAASNDNQAHNSQSDDLHPIRAEHFFIAAYLAFKGRTDQAQQFLPQPHDFTAIYGFGGGMASLYYLAQGYIAHFLHEGGNREGAMEGIDPMASDQFEAIFLFQRAFDLNPKSERAAKMLELLSGKRPEPPTFTPEKFYDVYSFPAHDPQNLTLGLVKPPVSYESALKDLKEGEFLLIILLGIYRANGFYSKAMTLLTQLYPLIGKHFPAIHIITAYDQSAPLKPHWLDGETFALECNLPVQILYDEDNEICTDMEINSSPQGLIIDHNGMIIHRSALDEEEGYWLAARLGEGKPTPPPSADILSFPFGKS